MDSIVLQMTQLRTRLDPMASREEGEPAGGVADFFLGGWLTADGGRRGYMERTTPVSKQRGKGMMKGKNESATFGFVLQRPWVASRRRERGRSQRRRRRRRTEAA